jgi:hypothetical protein
MPASPGKDPIRERSFSRLSLLKPDTFLESTPPRLERYNYRTKPSGLVLVIFEGLLEFMEERFLGGAEMHSDQS